MYVAPRLLEYQTKYDEGTGLIRHCSRLLSTVTADASSLLLYRMGKNGREYIILCNMNEEYYLILSSQRQCVSILSRIVTPRTSLCRQIHSKSRNEAREDFYYTHSTRYQHVARDSPFGEELMTLLQTQQQFIHDYKK
jgi:hypothetical protein